MTTTGQVRPDSFAVRRIGMLADRLIGLIRTIAQPSLVQLVMRIALGNQVG